MEHYKLVDRETNEYFDDVAYYDEPDYNDYTILHYGRFAKIRVYTSGLVEWLTATIQ